MANEIRKMFSNISLKTKYEGILKFRLPLRPWRYRLQKSCLLHWFHIPAISSTNGVTYIKQGTTITIIKFNFALSLSNDIPHEMVHSFPNHPLRKFIAYLPYFISYLPYFIANLTWFIAYLPWIISYQIILKLSENAVKIIHSLLTIDHSFPNHPRKMFIAFQTIPSKCSYPT